MISGPRVYKISETREGSRFCIERANLFFETGKCDYSVPNFYEFDFSTTADPLWGQQWGALNTGQYNGTQGADVRIEPAWQISTGNGVRVAVIDDGVQLDHPDFRRLDNAGNIIQNNILLGFDALLQGTNGAPLTTGNHHGPSCAGIIGAVSDNNIGISGIAPNCQIIPIRALRGGAADQQIGYTTSLARAMNWAWQNGAEVISCSWRTWIQSDLLEQAIIDATTLGRGGLGCVVIFAAGNDNADQLVYPAIMQEVIAVGAMSMCNTRKNYQSCDGESTWGSNYGNELEFVAPGVKIPTLRANNGTTDDFNGTSSACPHVAGIAALVLEINPNFTFAEVRRILEYSCNKVGSYCYSWTNDHPNGSWNNQMGYGRVNAFNAVQLALRATSYSNPTYNIPQQSNSLVSSSNFQLVMISPGCSALASSVYFVQRYEVTANITFANTNNPLIICTSNGWSAANPNDGKNFANATNVTNTSATLRSWVYKGYNSIGQFVGWFPTAPENVQFSYSIIGANNPITYQLFRTNRGQLSQESTRFIPYQFDFPGATNDRLIENVAGSSKILIFPNPSLDKFQISASLEKNEFIKRLEILTTTGLTIRSISNPPKSLTQISVSDIPKGVYLIKVSTNLSTYTSKVVKQ